MKVLLINGSPHEKGCTYTALSLIAKELNDAGVDTEILHVGGKPVGGCIGCGGCAAGNGCVFGGVVNEAIEKAKTADGFVFGSPVHYASASGNMTSFMDRLAYAGGRYLAYKPAAICCSARRAGTTTTLDQLVKYPQFFHMPLVNGSYWAMVHGSNAEQVLEDAEEEARLSPDGVRMISLVDPADQVVADPDQLHRILVNLMRNARQVVSKQQLLDQLYGDGEGDPNTIEVMVSRLRKKLDPEGNIQPISTIRRQGYIFNLSCN